jgi:hypothetical protein
MSLRPSQWLEALKWSAALILALASPIVYVVWNTELLWWVAPLGTVPLILLVTYRARRSGRVASDANHFGPSDNYPWTPPDGV